MATATCPHIGIPGRRVPPETLASLLHHERLAGVEGRDWFFCESPDCDVVYFTADGDTRTRGDLTVRVGVKEREDPRPLCYCFGHTARGIAEEIGRCGSSSVVQSITARVKAGDCSCETLNPRGACCLGDVRREVGRLLDEDVASRDAPPRGDCCAGASSEAQGTREDEHR